ncbi:MAG: hypothetical protein ACYCVB_06380 [Bacilli bacterium]
MLILSIVILHEQATPLRWAGTVVILVGVVLVQLRT